MRTLLILAALLGLVNCGHLNGLLEPPVSGGGYSSGYGNGFGSSSASASSHAEYNTIEYSSNEGNSFGNLDIGGIHGGASFGLHGHQGLINGGTSVNHQTQKVPIPIPQPYKVHVSRPVPVPVPVPSPVEVPRPVPVPVPQPVPVTITKPIPVTIPRPVPVPVQKPVYVRIPQPVHVPVAQPYPVVVPQPYPVRIQTPVTIPVPIASGLSGIQLGGISGGHTLIGASSFGNYANGNLGLGAYTGASAHDCPSPSFALENSVSLGGYAGKYAPDYSQYGGHSFISAPLNNGWVGKHNLHNIDTTINQAYDSNGGYKY